MINRFTTNWHDDLEDIRQMRNDLNANWGLMTDFEKVKYKNAFTRKREAAFKKITGGAIEEFRGMIRRYVRTGEEFDAEVRKEMNAWDPAKLNAEMQLAESRVQAIIRDGDQVAKGLKGLYQEATQSQDLHKIRAVTEALKGNHTKLNNLDDKMAVNGLAKEAEEKLKDLRMTEGMKQAVQKRTAERENLLQARRNLISISEDLGQGDPSEIYATGEYAKMMKVVQQDPATGQVIILPEDSPEVTGNYLDEVKEFYKKG